MQKGKYFLLGTVFLFIITVSMLGCDSASSDNSITISREECLGVPDCISVTASGLETIEGEGVHTLHLVCPDEAPNIHNIDVLQTIAVAGVFGQKPVWMVMSGNVIQHSDGPVASPVSSKCQYPVQQARLRMQYT